MATYREQDPLTTFLSREHARVLVCLAESDGATATKRSALLADVRRILLALDGIESEVLYAAFSRVRLRPETQALLDDSRGNRRDQLEALDRLVQKRAPRLRKLASAELVDLITSHDARLTTLLVPVLGSQLPRPVYRAIVQTILSRYEAAVTGEAETIDANATSNESRQQTQVWQSRRS